MTSPGRSNDLVVVIPGILGSRLEQTVRGETRTVWDLRLRTLPRTLLRLARGEGLARADAQVEPAGLISEPAWLPDFLGIDGYTDMVENLRTRLGDRLLTFAYDWRLSNAHTARLFRDAVVPELERWRDRPGHRDAQLVLICHSMGGLVARYFCEALGGAELTRRIITFGTPHRGSVKALAALAGPRRLGGLVDLSRMVQEWPSVWEMLPQYPCLQLPNASFTHLRTAPPAGLDAAHLAAALEFQAAIRTPAQARVDAGTACPYEQQVFFSRVQTTPEYAVPDGGGVRVLEPGSAGGGGDGTVPFLAAIPIEFGTTEQALPLLDKHAALPMRLAALEHLLNSLDPVDASGYKGIADNRAVALDVPPVVAVGEPAAATVILKTTREALVRVHDREHGNSWLVPAADTGAEERRGRILRADLGALPAGVYTVTCLTENPVSDHILVSAEAEPAPG